MFCPTGMALGPVMVPPSNANRSPGSNDARNSDIKGHESKLSTGHKKELVFTRDPATEQFSPSLLHIPDEDMRAAGTMAQNSMCVLPPTNPSFEMAYFLSTTGPITDTLPKFEKPKRVLSIQKSSFRFFRTKAKHSTPLEEAHYELNDVSCDPNKSLTDAESQVLKQAAVQVQPRVSKDGRNYLQIAPVDEEKSVVDGTPRLSRDIIDSQVSVIISEDTDDWAHAANNPLNEYAQEGSKASRNISQPMIRIITDRDDSPVRPAASDPPTPKQDSAIEVYKKEENKGVERFQVLDKSTPLSSHPRHSELVRQNTCPASPQQNTDLNRPTSNRGITLVQPSPRRLGSHPVLQRAASETSAMQWSHSQYGSTFRTTSVSPGPPPPRSPLRIQKHSHSIGDLVQEASNRLKDPKYGDTATRHQVANRTLANGDQVPQRTGDTASNNKHDAELLPVLDCQWNTRDNQRNTKVDQRNKSPGAINVVNKSTYLKAPRRRLVRARPQEPRPLHPSKVHTKTLDLQESQPVAPVHPQPPRMSAVDHMGSSTGLPFDRSNGPKVIVARKAGGVPLKGRKSPAPRPRSAIMPPRGGRDLQTPPRSKSPTKKLIGQDEHAPVLSSPPPTRELPPIPTKQTSDNSDAVNSIAAHKDEAKTTLPPSSLDFAGTSFPSPPSSARSAVSGLSAPTRTVSHGRHRSRSDTSGGMEARLEALERHNRLLGAALMAMLKTNGTLNGCPCHAEENASGSIYDTYGPPGHPAFAGERQSSGSSQLSSGAASYYGSGSGALDLYLSTRGQRGS